MAIIVTMTDEQAQTIGWALRMMRLEKLSERHAWVNGYAEPRGKSVEDRIAGTDERIAKLDDAYALLPPDKAPR